MSHAVLPFDVSLDGQWSFAYTPQLDGHPPLIPDEERFSATIDVPGYWDDQIEVFKNAPWADEVETNPDYQPVSFPIPADLPPDASLPHISGVGWYKTRIEVPKEWEGGSVVLTVGGAVIESFVYVNGAFIKRHLGNSTPFTADLTHHLRYGETNELVIAVSNLDRSIFGLSVRGYHGYTGGIFRSVSLHVSGPGVIDGLFLRPIRDRQTVRWWADLRSPHGTAGEEGTIHWRIRTLHQGTVIDEGSVPVRALANRETLRLEWETPAEGLAEWSVWEPNLYRAEVVWTSGSTVWDRKEQPFGLRTIERRGRDLFLNGRPIMLRGACDHYYFAPYANAPIDIDYYRNLLRTIKDVGYNFVRCHTWVPPEEYLQAADELGMIVQVELANGEGIDDLRRIVRFCRRHPSVAIYCGGNENLCDEKMLTFFEDMYNAAKELDPGCLIMPQQAMRGIEYHFKPEDRTLSTVDEPFKHDPKRLERIHHSTDVFGNYSWGWLSYISLQGTWRDLEKRFAVYHRPILSHEVGISGCYLNLELEERYTDRIPPDLYSGVREQLEKAGRLHMARRYYEASAMWQSLIRKHMFEKLRLCPSIKGYDHLGAWNAHWHRTGYDCGPFNEFLELKHGVTRESLLRYNGESVVVLDIGHQRAYWCGDEFTADVYVSLYGGRPLADGVLKWRLVSGDDVLRQGAMSRIEAPDGAVTRIGTLALKFPELPSARKVRLQVEVDGDGYNLANEWDLWVFPEVQMPSVSAVADDETYRLLAGRVPGIRPVREGDNASKLRIVSALTAADVEHLQKGNDVLLLGTGPFPARQTTFQIAVSGRSHQDLALLVNDHPVFAAVPHDGYCDWQFYSLIEGGRCVVFNELAVDFNPILEVVSSYKDMRWQAALWEAQTEGGGRLFVASCRFDMASPAAASLLAGILQYMRSDAFQPATQLSLREVVVPLLQREARVEAVGETDMALDPNVAKRLGKR